MTATPAVFVVDDEEPIRTAFELWLGARGIPVRTFASAEDFLAAYSAEFAGWLIIDARMPSMSGPDLCRELRSRDTALRIILMTGHGSAPAVREQLGQQTIVLEKPFAAETMERIIRPDSPAGDEAADN